MIQKLRRKFILINMLLVFTVLLAVFSCVCVSSYQRLVGESMAALHQALGRGMDDPFPRLEIGGKRPDRPARPFPAVPVFTVELDADNTVRAVRGENVTVPEDSVEGLIREVLAAGGGAGVLPGYSLRFQAKETGDGTRIAFADTSGERASMGSILLTSLAVGTGALAAFFFISLFLARWALRPVEHAWNQQQQFVADASHELKTPLTVILANTGIVLSHQEDTVARQAKWVENTREEAVRMKCLVDDLLFLAKSDAYRAPPQLSEFNLSDAVWSSVLPFESLAFERGVDIHTEIEPDLLFTGHEGQVKQLAAILLDNACKYAGGGGAVNVCLRRDTEKLRLSVHNTGDPIPPEDLPHLFERFYRTDKSRARVQGGYGLGLAIAESIVETHGGKITVESSARDGTVFRVCLPEKAPAGKKEKLLEKGGAALRKKV